MANIPLRKGEDLHTNYNIWEFSKALAFLPWIVKDDIEREGPLNAKQKPGMLKVESWIVSDKK